MRTLTSPRSSSPPAPNGYTLIELLVVLTIIALLAAGVAWQLPRAGSVGSAGRDSLLLRRAVASSRDQAMRTGQAVPLSVDRSKVSADIVIRPADRSESIRFYADGSSNGGVLLRNGQTLLEIDWLTGCARDVR